MTVSVLTKYGNQMNGEFRKIRVYKGLNSHPKWFTLSYTMMKALQTYRSKQLMDQADDNSLTALLTKKDQVRFCEIVNTCTERWEEKPIQRTAWILSHVLRKTLCEHVNGLCPAGWLNEQSIKKHWFQSVRTCSYSCGHWLQHYTRNWFNQKDFSFLLVCGCIKEKNRSILA